MLALLWTILVFYTDAVLLSRIIYVYDIPLLIDISDVYVVLLFDKEIFFALINVSPTISTE